MMGVVGKILRFFVLVPVIFRNIAVAILVIVTALLFLESVVRTCSGASIIVVTEVGGLGMLFIVFLGLGWVYQIGGHLRVGFAVDRIPGKQSRVLNLFLSILSLAFVGFAMHIWLDMTSLTRESGRFLFLLHMAEWPFQMVAVVGWGVLALAILERTISQVRQIFGKPSLGK